MPNRNIQMLALAVVIFAILLAVASNNASQRAVWIDEVHAQVTTISPMPYSDIFLGKAREGNRSPLFFASQKFVLTLLGHDPARAEIDNPESRLLLRVLPMTCMALAVALMFYFFSTQYALWAGGVSLVLSLTSYMLWAYICDARPYAIWFLLSSIQLVSLLSLLKNGKGLAWLVAANILLSLTIIFTLVQIVAVSMVYWFAVSKRWSHFIGLTILPIALCMFYFSATGDLKYHFQASPLDVFSAGMPKERLLMALVFLAGICLAYLNKFDFSFQSVDEKTKIMMLACLGLFFLTVGGYLMILLRFAVYAIPGEGYRVPNRYFVGLSPLSIVGTTLFMVWITQLHSARPIKIGFIVFFCILIGTRAAKYLPL